MLNTINVRNSMRFLKTTVIIFCAFNIDVISNSSHLFFFLVTPYEIYFVGSFKRVVRVVSLCYNTLGPRCTRVTDFIGPTHSKKGPMRNLQYLAQYSSHLGFFLEV